MEHIPVKIRKIPEGLHLDCKIYLKKGDGFSFLCENIDVTPELIVSFIKKALPDDSVYITADYMETFHKRGIDLGWKPPDVPDIEMLEIKRKPEGHKPKTEFEVVKERYDKARQETKELFDDIALTNIVDIETTDEFVNNIGEKLEKSDVSLILQSINGIRNVDEYLHTHSLNVAFLNGLMAKWLKLDKQRHDQLVKIGLLHDIGKLKVPAEVLNKPGRLTPEEFDKIKKHPYYSFDIMAKSGMKEKAILLGILQHHEKLNGTGYPSGIGSRDITEFARITSISDIYDAMVAKRVYKEAHSPFEILDSFSKEGYSQLDINYVKLFIGCMVEELKGKKIVLSDGSVATVVMVSERNLMYPMVKINNEIITTNPGLHCVSMFNMNVSEEEVQRV